MTGKSTKARRKNKSQKPEKPFPDFPMFAHPSGRWCKKFKGDFYYFGKWDDWQGALEKFKREWPYISQGLSVPHSVSSEALTVGELADEFLNSKRSRLESGELSERSFRDYFQCCARMVDQFKSERHVEDLRPSDFEKFRAKLARRFGTVTLKNEINRCRVVFKYAHDQRLIKEPVHFGQSFNRPSAKDLRRARNQAGPKMFEQKEIVRILDALDGKVTVQVDAKDKKGRPAKKKKKLKTDPALKAMVLLGINCGFGNTDVATLPQSAVDLNHEWIEFPRPKTEIQRQIPLWPETVEAVREAIDKRPKPAKTGYSHLCFLTGTGNPWVRMQENKKEPDKMTPIDALSQKFRKLLNGLDINGQRGFYCLRHCFETIGGESRDQVAVNAIMGHVDSSMAANYRHRISDERLRAVTETVRAWLWPDEEAAEDDEPAAISMQNAG